MRPSRLSRYATSGRTISTSIGTPDRALKTPPSCQPPTSRSAGRARSLPKRLPRPNGQIVQCGEVRAVADIEVVVAALGAEIVRVLRRVRFVRSARIADAVRIGVLPADREAGGETPVQGGLQRVVMDRCRRWSCNRSRRSGCRIDACTMAAPVVGFVPTSVIRFVMLRRNRLRPWLPT